MKTPNKSGRENAMIHVMHKSEGDRMMSSRKKATIESCPAYLENSGSIVHASYPL